MKSDCSHIKINPQIAGVIKIACKRITVFIMDYISNYVLMPVVSIATCVYIGWVLKPKSIIDEVTRNGEKFGREKLYVVMIKYITPVLLMLLLLQALGILKF